MTNDCPQTEDDLRLQATRDFARTMIFVDDEAALSEKKTEEPSAKPLKKPESSSKQAENGDAPVPEPESSGVNYVLDAKQLIDSAMEKGLICSILRPGKDDSFEDRVVEAAKFADIVCLDWEIYGDAGDSAKGIIKRIVDWDNKINGRSRLIAIYTGDTRNPDILKNILNTIHEDVSNNSDLSENSFACELDTGARLVCLFKSTGSKLDRTAEGYAYQVNEHELPDRLLKEFSKLSKGLMSNVALATIASIRQSTHHVLSSFARNIDGAYFHHRALIDNPEDAGGYAVEVVLSELKGTIDKQNIAERYAGKNAIETRIREIAADKSHLELNYEEDGNSTCSVKLEDSIKAVTEGYEIAYAGIQVEGLSKKKLKVYLSSLFADDWQEASSQMLKFSALTSLRAHPKNYLYVNRTRKPQLGLGTIVRNQNGKYLLCLQAICDSVRIEQEQRFIFIELEQFSSGHGNKHFFTVPNPDSDGYLRLKVSGESYRALRLIKFSPDNNSNTVLAKLKPNCSRFWFESGVGEKAEYYCWIADVKRRRAMRSAEGIARHFARLGFDEFAPFQGKEN